MSEKQEQDPFDELKDIFQEAAGKAREAWLAARKRSEATKQENEIYREIATLGSAALDALERAVKKAWEATGRK